MDFLPIPEAVVADLVLLQYSDWRTRSAFLCTSRGHSDLARTERVFEQRQGAAALIQGLWKRAAEARARPWLGKGVMVAYGTEEGWRVSRGYAVSPPEGHPQRRLGIGILPRRPRPEARLLFWHELEEDSDLSGDVQVADFCAWRRVLAVQPW